MLPITQYMLREILPMVYGQLTKILYYSSRVRIGRNFKTDSVPRILIDGGAKLEIGNKVEFRRNVEIRVHGNALTRIGDGVLIDRGVRILATNDSKVLIENGVRIGLYAVLNGGDSIFIGSRALISGFVYLQTSMHSHSEVGITIQDQGYTHGPVLIGSDTWLGAHVVIMPGVSIGNGVIVGSNAVVTSDIDSGDVVVGIPAKKISSRNKD